MKKLQPYNVNWMERLLLLARETPEAHVPVKSVKRWSIPPWGTYARPYLKKRHPKLRWRFTDRNPITKVGYTPPKAQMKGTDHLKFTVKAGKKMQLPDETLFTPMGPSKRTRARRAAAGRTPRQQWKTAGSR